jgi:transcription antitermination factor NusG
VIAVHENPPIRFYPAQISEGTDVAWWLAHTKSRSEKAFAWDLNNRDIEYFLPMLESSLVSGGRKRRVLKPLFPSYVFFRGDPDARQRALETDRLCQVIPVTNQVQLENELAALNTALAHEKCLDPFPFAATGRRCRVARGALRGIDGVVIERQGITKIILQVSVLGRGVPLNIDASMLESAE